MVEIFANARIAINIVRLSRYAFKINYHTVSWEILVDINAKYMANAFKLRNFIAVGLVVNKMMIYEWILIKFEVKIELSWFPPGQFHLNLLGSLKSKFWKIFQIWGCSRREGIRRASLPKRRSTTHDPKINTHTQNVSHMRSTTHHDIVTVFRLHMVISCT